MKRSLLLGSCLAIAACWFSGCATISSTKATSKLPAPTKGTATVKRPSVSASDEKLTPEQALADFERRRDEAQLEAAQSWLQQGNLSQAEAAITQLLGRNAAHREGRLIYAQIRLEQQRPGEAIADIQNLVTQKPSDPDAHYLLGLLLDSAGEPDQAQQCFAQAVALDGDNDLYQISHEAASAGSLSSGTVGTSTTGKIPTAASIVSNAGNRSTPKRRPSAEAEAQFAQEMSRLASAMHAEPDNPQIPHEASLLALRCNKPGAAIEVLEPLQQRFAGYLPLQRTLSMAYYRHGNYVMAEQGFRRVLKLDNTDSLAYFSLGCTLAKSGQTEAADECYAAASRLDPRFSTASPR